MTKFKVKIKNDKVTKGFRKNTNYIVLAIDRDNLLLGDKKTGALSWFTVDSVIFVTEVD